MSSSTPASSSRSKTGAIPITNARRSWTANYRQLLQENAEVVLHWGIVLEIADGYARIGRRAKGCQLLERFEQEYEVRPITPPIFADAGTLYRSRTDKEWSLTDCVSFVLMSQEGMTEALTADGHFRQAGFVALLLGTA